jgi:hypothetical protein
VFHQVVDEIPHLTRLTLQGLGEPLLSPYLLETIRTAVQRKDHRWIQPTPRCSPAVAAELVDGRGLPSAFGTAGSSFGSCGAVVAGKAIRPVRRTQHQTARVNIAGHW